MSDAAMIVAGAIACLGLAGAGSAFGTGFAASAAVGAWKKCYAANKPAPFLLLSFVGAPITQTLYGMILMFTMLGNGNKITVQALENTPEKSLKKINQTIGYNFVVVMCKNGINVVPKAPDYESGVVEPFDRNSVKKVAERAAEVFLQIKYLF